MSARNDFRFGVFFKHSRRLELVRCRYEDFWFSIRSKAGPDVSTVRKTTYNVTFEFLNIYTLDSPQIKLNTKSAPSNRLWFK